MTAPTMEKVNSATKASATAALAESAEVIAKHAAIVKANAASAATPGTAKKKKTPGSRKKKRKSPFLHLGRTAADLFPCKPRKNP